MKQKEILWVSGIAWMSDNYEYFPKATDPGLVSSSAFQQAIIEGLEAQGEQVRLLSTINRRFSRVQWSHNGKSQDIIVEGINGHLTGLLSKKKRLLAEINKKNFLDGIKIVSAYEMHLPYLYALRSIKKKNPEIKTILICPDLSTYMDIGIKKKPIKYLLKKVESMIMKRLLSYVDGFVVFTNQMYEYFSYTKKPYVVVEGVYRNKYDLTEIEKQPIILHAGSLHYNTGIEELIEAFEKIDNSDVELWFCGKGEMDSYIHDKCKKNSKIKHKGFVDPKDLFEYEKQALLLVNVRDPKENYTKYSFPSKTFEYMASGTPFLTTDLEGIPEEYKQNLLLIENNEVETIKNGLLRALNMTKEENRNFGNQARNFVLEKKNKQCQSKIILDFMSALVNKKGKVT